MSYYYISLLSSSSVTFSLSDPRLTLFPRWSNRTHVYGLELTWFWRPVVSKCLLGPFSAILLRFIRLHFNHNDSTGHIIDG